MGRTTVSLFDVGDSVIAKNGEWYGIVRKANPRSLIVQVKQSGKLIKTKPNRVRKHGKIFTR
jgi:uncharacterized protein YkvS